MISIIGAGPVGSYLAYLLSSQGMEVKVYEEHGIIGQPVHCTGIVTSKFSQIINPDEDFVVNTINRARIYAPNDDFLDLKLGQNLVLDRAKLDQKLAEGARKADAKYYTSHKFIGYKNGKITLEHEGKLKKLSTDLLVGSDGPMSHVAKSTGLYGNRKFFVGTQARATLKNDNAVEFYLIPKGFGWIVPESKGTVRIGVVSETRHRENFTSFLERKLGKNYITNVLEYHGGLIPLHDPGIKTSSGKIFLVGDAATMVKATTGGGIVPGLLGAEALAESIQTEKDYEAQWREKIGRELRLTLTTRKLMDSFTEQDYNLLIRLMNKESIRNKLENYDRDSMTDLLPSLLLEALKEPRFLHFAKLLFNRNLYI
jgi:digeranylgeranylglycerophospholipid reductase